MGAVLTADLRTLFTLILRDQVVRVRRPDTAWLRKVLGGRHTPTTS